MLVPKPTREVTMRVRAVLLAAALTLAPLGVRAADLVVWWEEGFYPEEDAAVREIIAAFEQKSGRKVELTFHSQPELLSRISAAVKTGHPPDVVYGGDVAYIYFPHWAYEGRLADLTDALGPLVSQFEKDALDQSMLLDAPAGRRSLYT